MHTETIILRIHFRICDTISEFFLFLLLLIIINVLFIFVQYGNYFGHTLRKDGNYAEKEILQGMTSGKEEEEALTLGKILRPCT